MRVLIIHNQLWAHYKSKLFSEIHKVLQQQNPDDQIEVLQIALYESTRKGMQAEDDTVRYSYPYQVLFPTSLDEVSVIQKTKALFAAFQHYKPDVLNITGYFDPAQVLLLFFAKLMGVKTVISSESSAADHTRSTWKEKIKSLVIRHADAIFCFGKTSADYMKALGAPDDKIQVRNAAVIDDLVIRKKFDEAVAKGNKMGRNFIYVGRLAPEKNLLLLLKAFQSAQQEIAAAHDWGIILVGEGPDKDDLQQFVDHNKLENIRFTGGCAWHEVPTYLAASDVLVLPSKSEPWGLVVNEAMVCGMPVIVSEKCGCVPDLVQNQINGWIFNPESESSLGDTLKFFMLNPEKVAPMGAASLGIVSKFAASEVAASMVKCYKYIHKPR